ncbi:MAG: V-type ATP synthase subunit K [Candidatus Diapherotrites archaeon]|nr:V-type ATP synthase subunit K [Candidatus Diapherotrites archaeon]
MIDPDLAFGLGLMAIGAGIGVGVAAGLSAIGQGMTTAAAVGAVTEKDDYSFGKMVVLSAITETQAIYGFVTAMMIIFVLALGSGFFT